MAQLMVGDECEEIDDGRTEEEDCEIRALRDEKQKNGRISVKGFQCWYDVLGGQCEWWLLLCYLDVIGLPQPRELLLSRLRHYPFEALLVRV